MSYGKRIRKRREELGLSVEGLAAKIGKSRATVYRYENGDIEDMPITIIEPLAKALETTPDYLMGWDGIISTDELKKQVEERAEEQFFDLIYTVGYEITELESGRYELESHKFTGFTYTTKEELKKLEKTIMDYVSYCADKFYNDQKTKILNNKPALNAAHERTDIEVTDEMRKHDDDIMNDDDFWKD